MGLPGSIDGSLSAVSEAVRLCLHNCRQQAKDWGFPSSENDEILVVNLTSLLLSFMCTLHLWTRILSLFLCFSLKLTCCLYVCLSPSLYLSVCLSIYLCLYVCFILCLCLSLSLSLYSSIYLSIYLSISASLSASFHFPVSTLKVQFLSCVKALYLILLDLTRPPNSPLSTPFYTLYPVAKFS